MAGIGPRSSQVVPPDDLYTTLLIVAAALLFVGTIFIAVRSVQMFDSLWPAGGA